MRPYIAVLTATFVGCLLGVAQAADPDASTRTPEEVAAHHFAAAAAGDLDALMSDYADNAVMVNAAGVKSGKAAIRAGFDRGQRPSGPVEPLTAAQFSHMQTMQMGALGTLRFIQRQYSSNTALLLFVNNAGKPNEVHNVETLVIRNGKIVLQTAGAFRGQLVTPQR